MNERFRPDEIAALRTTADAFREKFKVPGLSIAVARHGKLALVETFGWADVDAREALTPAHRFRIASVSKPITAVAVLWLAERRKLALTDRVFGDGALLGTRFGTAPYGKWVEQITVEHLLSHTAGGWGNERDDPMAREPSLDHAHLIGLTLDTRPLESAPGTRYAYSNFGYCLLGRVIEAVSGLDYPRFVRETLLHPCGADAVEMALPGPGRLPGEVRYYSQNDGNPLEQPVARMDAHGGWVATPTDILRFAVRVDGFKRPPDLLSAASLRAMTTASKTGSGYALGWQVNAAQSWWHLGELPGVSSLLVRTADGFCWAALANTRRPNSPLLLEFDELLWKLVRCIKAWPDDDLFVRKDNDAA